MENEEQNQSTVPVTDTPEQPAPEMEAPEQAPAQEEAEIGPIVGSIIVILVIIAGGVYFWFDHIKSTERLNAIINTELPENDETLTDLTEVSTSDDIAAIENDLENTDIEELDDDLGDIDALLDADLDNL